MCSSDLTQKINRLLGIKTERDECFGSVDRSVGIVKGPAKKGASGQRLFRRHAPNKSGLAAILVGSIEGIDLRIDPMPGKADSVRQFARVNRETYLVSKG